MLIAIAAAVALLAQAAPTGTAPPAAAPAAAKPAQPEKPKMVCTWESQTGSNFSKRVCLTPEESKAREEDARRQSEAMRACKTGMGC